MTEMRGKKANLHMRKEWRTLCEVIYDCGYRLDDGTAAIRFGDLFQVSQILIYLKSYHIFPAFVVINDNCAATISRRALTFELCKYYILRNQNRFLKSCYYFKNDKQLI